MKTKGSRLMPASQLWRVEFSQRINYVLIQVWVVYSFLNSATTMMTAARSAFKKLLIGFSEVECNLS